MGKTKKNQSGLATNDFFRYGPRRQKFIQPQFQQSLFRNYSPYECHILNQNQYKTNRKHRHKKVGPVSPVLDSSEHMNKKIEETSAIIMQQILNPTGSVISLSIGNDKSKSLMDQPQQPLIQKASKRSKSFHKTNKNIPPNDGKIQEKIMNHLNNLTEGKKRNFINSDKTEYDMVVQQIMQQKRLEISRTLRHVLSKGKDTDSSNFVNPDVGIKIEDLPHNLIAELRQALNFDIDKADKDTIDSCPDDILLNILNNFIQSLDSPELYSRVKNEEDKIINSTYSQIKESLDKNEFDRDAIVLKSSSSVHQSLSSKKIKEEYFIEDNRIVDYENTKIKLEPEENFAEYNSSDKYHIYPDLMAAIEKNVNSSITKTREELSISNIKSIISSPIANTENKLCDISTQTDDMDEKSINKFIELNLREIPRNFDDAIEQMYQIDNWISHLTAHRQNIFITLSSLLKENKLGM